MSEGQGAHVIDEPLAFRIYVEDTDATGLVYHARYLNFCERARTLLLTRDNPKALRDLHASGLYFVVTSIEANFHHPLRLNDVFSVEALLVSRKRASFVLLQRIVCDDLLCFDARITLACINDQGKCQRLPDALLDVFGEVDG